MLQTSQGTGSGLEVEYSAMVHEMAEALQAVAGYVGAARRMAIGTIEDSASPLRDIRIFRLRSLRTQIEVFR